MPANGLKPRRLKKNALWALVLAAGAACAVCAWLLWPTPQAAAPRPVTVLISGDTAGWIVPCGCTSNQSGGLPRRGTYVRTLRAGTDVLVVDAGGAAGGTSAYHQVKFEAILLGELALGLTAHNLGGPEAAMGAEYLREVANRLKVPFLSTNLRDAHGERIAEPMRVVEIAGRRIALAGVVARRYAAHGLQADDPRDALLKIIAASRGTYDALVVLAYLPEEELSQLAAALPEADAVVGGPTGQSVAPRQLGPTLVASATNKGKFLIELAAPTTGKSWSGKVVEMGPELGDDPQQQENLAKYLTELGRRDFPAHDTGLAPTLPAGLPADYRVAGSASCRACHANDCTAWDASAHAAAWARLGERGFQVDAYCQQCHTTGFGVPGGFESVRRSPQAVNVGCESCHGPSLAHQRDPSVKTAFAARDQCARCHDRENSPKFDYAAYWPQIRHGVAATPAAHAREPGSK